MAKVIVINMMSLNGFYSGLDSDMSKMGVDDGFNRYNAGIVKTASLALIGRKSFESFSSYWPERADAADASENEIAFANIYNPLRKIVVTNDATGINIPESWKESTNILSENVYHTIEQLKQDNTKDILIWGSRTLWHNLMKHGLVDEIHLVIGNGIVSEGVSLFHEAPNSTFTPFESYVMDGSQLIVSKYSVQL